MTTPAHNEPSVLADGFLGIAFRRLREGLLPHMRSVLGDDFQVEIGPQENRRIVRLTDTTDLYDLLVVWLHRRRRRAFQLSFTPDRPAFSAGNNWLEEINDLRSGIWARQGYYKDDDARRILNTISAMLDDIAAVQKTEAAERLTHETEHLAREFQTYLYQRSYTNPPDASDRDDGAFLFDYTKAIATRLDEPNVLAEGLLSKAWRRLGEGLGPYMESKTGESWDNPRDVGAILSGNLKKADQRIYRECSNLLEARNKWAHQGNYKYSYVRKALDDIVQVLRAIPENELAQAVERMRNELHNSARRSDVFDTPDGAALVLSSETPIAPSPPHTGDSVRLADTAEYYHRGEWQNAVTAANTTIAHNPDLAVAYLVRGQAHARLGNMEAAEADSAAATRISQQLEQAVNYFDQGVAAYHKDNTDHAIDSFSHAIELNSLYARAYNNWGAAYADIGEYDKAIADYDTAISINPRFDAAYNNRGAAYADIGEYDKAIADYDAAISINPGNDVAYHNRGVAHHLKGDYKAITDYDAALELVTTDDEKSQSLREEREQIIRLRDEMIAFDQAIADSPDDPDTWHLRGLHYRDEREDYDHAIADFNEALRRTPSNPENLYYNRGLAHEKLRDDDSAIYDYGRAVATKSNYPEAHYALGMIRTRRRQHREAIADFNQAIAHSPDYALAYHRRGVCYYHLGNKEQASTDFNKAAQLGFNP